MDLNMIITSVVINNNIMRSYSMLLVSGGSCEGRGPRFQSAFDTGDWRAPDCYQWTRLRGWRHLIQDFNLRRWQKIKKTLGNITFHGCVPFSTSIATNVSLLVLTLLILFLNLMERCYAIRFFIYSQFPFFQRARGHPWPYFSQYFQLYIQLCSCFFLLSYVILFSWAFHERLISR